MGCVTGLKKRLFLFSFLIVFVYCGVEGKELWPMTGWRLFSHLRTDTQSSWEVDYLDAQGRSQPVPFAQMSWAYRGSPQVLKGFPGLPEKEQIGVCSAWLSAVGALDIEATQLEIYRTTWRLSERDGLRARLPDRTLAFECSSQHVRER
ncbi:MAG TPA: hypothetical protein VNA87_02975 [Actinomycetota bacterium]|nr:hypothetical protein [Actinomycetota bacterium]